MPRYNPGIFVQDTIEHAQAVILQPEQGLTTQARWEQETAWLADIIKFPDPQALVIDYGCGIGRMAKVLPNSVMGVDISPTMRAHALEYVHRASFITTHPPMLRLLIEAGLRAHGALSIWCLQHVQDPGYDGQLLFDVLESGGTLWTLDRLNRCIPAVFQDGMFIWADDQVSVLDSLQTVGFELVSEQEPPIELCAEGARLRQWLKP
jgi:SAM-dependent methyltransferase